MRDEDDADLPVIWWPGAVEVFFSELHHALL
jgi:hypothetical protein